MVCTPVQVKQTRLCKCDTVPPTPVPTTLAPTMAPTPMVADTVAVVRIAGVASASLRTRKINCSTTSRDSPKLLQLRKAFADALTVPLRTVSITKIKEDMELEKSAEAQITGHVVPGTVLTLRVSAANAADAEDAATSLVAPPFADMLSSKIIDRGFDSVQPGGGAIRIARPVVHIAQKAPAAVKLHHQVHESQSDDLKVGSHSHADTNEESNVPVSLLSPSTLWSYVAPFAKALGAGIAVACVGILLFVVAQRCSLRMKRGLWPRASANESAPLNRSTAGSSLTLTPTGQSAYRVDWSTARDRTRLQESTALSDGGGRSVALQMRALRAREAVRTRSTAARGNVDKPRIELDADGAALV
mgnify:CR=1 FL=1